MSCFPQGDDYPIVAMSNGHSELNFELCPYTMSPYHRIVGDGNCAFSALSKKIHGTVSFQNKLRRSVVEYIALNWDFFEALVDQSKFRDPETYSANMIQDGTYGDVAEVRAAGAISKRTVAIVERGHLFMSSIHPGDTDPIVLRRSGEHFDLYVGVPSGILLDDRSNETLEGLGGVSNMSDQPPRNLTPESSRIQAGSATDSQDVTSVDNGNMNHSAVAHLHGRQKSQTRQERKKEAEKVRRERIKMQQNDERNQREKDRKKKAEKARRERIKMQQTAEQNQRQKDQKKKAEKARREGIKSSKGKPRVISEATRARDRERQRARREMLNLKSQVNESKTHTASTTRQMKRKGGIIQDLFGTRPAKGCARNSKEREPDDESDSDDSSEDDSMWSDENDCSDEEQEGEETDLLPPNNPLVVRRLKEKVTERLKGVAAYRCYICDRILNRSQVKIVNPESFEVPTKTDTPVKRIHVNNEGLSRLIRDLIESLCNKERAEIQGLVDQLVAEMAMQSKGDVMELLSSVNSDVSEEGGENVTEVQNLLIHGLAKKDKAYVRELVDSLLTVPGRYEFCGTCNTAVKKGKVPSMAVWNGFRYPDRPAHLPELTEVGNHIMAPRVPFQHITNLGRMGKRGQYGIRGSVINIPTEPGETVKQIIPLMPREDHVYVVNLKRKLIHKRPYSSSFVKKRALTEWGTYLTGTELYRKYGVTFNQKQIDEEPETNDDPDDPENQDFDGQAQYSVLVPDGDIPESPSPEPADHVTDEINVAPGENREPLSVVRDRECEELSFPTVYLGQPRRFRNHVTRYQAMKSEVRRVDRRGARPQALLYKYAVHCREQACRRLRHRFKRKAATVLGAAVTKKQFCDPNFTTSSQKQGLAMPSLTPNSAQYWKTAGHDLFGMIRQLGRPTIFLTLSAAEYHWPILLDTLKKLSEASGEMQQEDGRDEVVGGMPQGRVSPEVLQAVDEVLSNPDASTLNCNIPGDERFRLIRDDPIICCLYFREIVIELRKCLKMKNGPMGKHRVKDFFFRIEFQARGSPHLHCLLWVENAPADPLQNPEEAAAFVDTLLSCSSKHPLAERNLHRHRGTCFKNKRVLGSFLRRELTPQDMHRHCRFGAPFYPMDHTKIVLPLFVDRDERSKPNDITWENYVENIREIRLRIKDVLVSEDCPDTLDEVWRAAGCPDEETYLLAIRSNIKRPTVLYRRDVADRWTNSHMPWVLECFESNTDSQLILDVYSLVRYCVSYITKGEKAYSDLHKEILRLRAEHRLCDKDLMYRLSSQALRTKETSAQEAAWVLLQFPLSEKSRTCKFINTSMPDERDHCPKSDEEIGMLDDDSTDLWRNDVFDRYAMRPPHLEHTSLAVYVARHLYSNRKPDANGHIPGREKDWIIRYRKFDSKSEKGEERESFFRAMYTLHVPWRNEKLDILVHGEDGGSFEELYNSRETDILEGRRRFEFHLDLEEEMQMEVSNCVAQDEEEINEADDQLRHYMFGEGKLVFEEAEHMDSAGQDISLDLPASAPPPDKAPVAAVRRRGEWDRSTFLKNIRMLNPLQKMVVLLVIDGIRLRSKPRCIFIDGTAGCGKSVIARCIANAFETFAPNNHPGYPKCAISAPTGKAADNVGGMTLHSTYALPLTQEATAAKQANQRNTEETDVIPRLEDQRLARLQNNFCDMYGHLIDEISMVSQRALLSVEQRCKEATCNRADFGGLWTIVFGDFRQLPPVAGGSIIEDPEKSIAGAIPLWMKFEYVELTQNMRQGEDKVFADVLRKIGNYEKLTTDERNIIESRFIRKNNLTVPDSAVRLFFKNKDVENFTTRKLRENPSHKILLLEARDRVVENRNYFQCGPKSARRKAEGRAEVFLANARKLKATKARGLPFSLIAVAGFPYMVTSNIDTADGLVNGSVGELKWVEFASLQEACRPKNSDGTVQKVAVKRLWLRFPGRTGRERSARYQQVLREAVSAAPQFEGMLGTYMPPPPPTEEEMDGRVPIEMEDVVLNNVKTEPWRHVKRQQFPLVSALAMTIHKVQGSTKDCIVTIYSPTWPNDLVYVALSRVTTLSELFIDDHGLKPDNLFQHPPRADVADGETVTAKERRRRDEVRQHLARLEEERERLRRRALVPRWQGLVDAPSTVPRAVYLNAQSLLAHQEDIRLDEVLMAAHTLLIAETWLQPGDHVSLGEEYRLVARCDRGGGRRGGGVAIYSKLQCEEVQCRPHQDIEVAMVHVGSSHRMAVLYCHGKPNATTIVDVVRDLLTPAPGRITVVCGDFNVDMMGSRPSAQGRELLAGLEALGLSIKNSTEESTTYDSEGTVIDGVFSDAPSLNVERYQAYYSHHLPLVLFL